MGLVPEFFVFLGIVIFLAMSLLSALLDRDLPSLLQYFFQIAAIVGFGEASSISRLPFLALSA